MCETPDLGIKVATVTHFAVWKAGGGGHEGGLPAGCEEVLKQARVAIGRDGQPSMSARSWKECGWSQSKLCCEEGQNVPWTDRHRNVKRKVDAEGGCRADIGWSDEKK